MMLSVRQHTGTLWRRNLATYFTAEPPGVTAVSLHNTMVATAHPEILVQGYERESSAFYPDCNAHEEVDGAVPHED